MKEFLISGAIIILALTIRTTELDVIHAYVGLHGYVCQSQDMGLSLDCEQPKAKK